MRIASIEPTPNPNSMKLNMDQSLPEGEKHSYTPDRQEGAPAYLRAVLAVPGVRSVYQVADFIALERRPQADWQQILAEVRRVLEGDSATPGASAAPGQPGPARAPGAEDTYGEVQVHVQMLRGIPMQIKLVSGSEQVRVALPERFKRVSMRAAEALPDVLAERKWVEQGVRYGDLNEVGATVAAEVDAAYDDQRLQSLLEQALAGGEAEPQSLSPRAVAAALGEPEWQRRYAALERLEPQADAVPVLATALSDRHVSVRRLATVLLGAVEDADVLPYLLQELEDPSPAVRRAAGDALSDRAETGAIAAMARALGDPSKLVRWRAARFLYEVGDESALPALREAQEDAEFEVRLQVRMAIERIEGGHGAVEPVWQQMTRRLRGDGH